jgi:ATP-dependent DNA ligase
VAFDLLQAHGVDLRPLPLRDCKAWLARIGKNAKGWLALTTAQTRNNGRRYSPPKYFEYL